MYLTIILLAAGLSMDAFAVAVTNGLCIKLNKKQYLFIALAFGIMQGLMPVAGYYLGKLFYNFVQNYAHWIAFALLILIGGSMILEAVGSKIKKEPLIEKKFKVSEILLQSLATSIDALAVGISLLAMPVNIFVSASIITALTFCVALFGVFLGKRFEKLIDSKYHLALIFGGLILIGIGIKMLF